VKVEIYGQQYNLSVAENEDYLKELAAYVDAKMHAVSQAAQTVDTGKVAVLAAMNMADELFLARSRQQELQGPLRERVQKCVTLVERAIEQSN
jgi:cell division protein ZapA